jgi:predicted permease
MTRSVERLTRDLAYALRSFRRTPGPVLVALLSLTLGIGAASSIFSVIYGVLISPYPYARPGEIWAPRIAAIDGRGGRGYQLGEFRRLQELPAFSDVMATSFEPVLLTGEYAPESFFGVLMSGNAFDFLGVPPVAGRTLQPSDIRRDGTAEPVVVLSHRLWLRLFDGSPAAVGRTLRLNGIDHTVVGVMPPRFGWYGNDGFWLPLSPTRTDLPNVNPIMRLAPGVTKEVAEQQLSQFNKQLAAENPSTFPSQGFTSALQNYLDVTVASGEMRTSLRLLIGAVGFLLLIACANVANLQLARGTTRAREMAVRMSLGAPRRRLVQQLLTENILLAMIGGATGILFAFGATRAIVALMPEFYVPNESRVTLNGTVLAFSVGLSVLTGILFGLAPALQTSGADLSEALKAARSTAARGEGRRSRNLLVVAEVALAVVLLVSAGLTVRTFFVLQHVDAGIDSGRVLVVGVPLPAAKYVTLEQRNRVAHDLLERVRALPGVEAATFGLPFGGPQSLFQIDGQPPESERRLTVNFAGAEHLPAFTIPLRRGRMFDAGEVLRGDRVAVINEAAAKLWSDGRDPIGSRVRLGVLEQPPARALVDTRREPTVTIIGIIADTKNAGIRSPTSPAIIAPYSLLGAPQRTLAVRTSGDPNQLLNPIRVQVRELDPEQPLGRPITLDEILGQEVVQPRFTMALFSTFAALGLVLAAVGIYSVLSFHVTLRTPELGVRMALGASRGDVQRLMLGMGAKLVLVGFAVGVAVSVGAARLLRSQLFGVQPADPLAYAGVILLLAAVTFLACYLPARRAAGVDPMVALRQD